MTLSEMNTLNALYTPKYKVVDETGKQVLFKSDNLLDAIRFAKDMYFIGLREYGLIEYFRVVNTRIGTTAFVTGN